MKISKNAQHKVKRINRFCVFHSVVGKLFYLIIFSAFHSGPINTEHHQSDNYLQIKKECILK